MKNPPPHPKEDYYKAEAQAFVNAHPDYKATVKNRTLLFDALQKKDLDLTRENLALIWEELKAGESADKEQIQ